MKKSLYGLMLAAGTALLAGCMTLEEIRQAKREREEQEAKEQREKFEQAKAKADAGDGNMAYAVARCMKDGKIVAKDPKQALVYYEKAAKAGVVIPISDCLEVLNIIEKTGDTERSTLFGDCYQKVWETLFVPYIWQTEKYSERNNRDIYWKLFKENFDEGVKMCLTYLDTLEKAGKNKEKYELKQRLMAIVKKEHAGGGDYRQASGKVHDFLEKLWDINTEAEEKRIAEEKVEDELRTLGPIKYSSPDGASGIKLYKHFSSGISLQWFILETLKKNKSIFPDALYSKSYQGVEFYFSTDEYQYQQIYSTTLYPGVKFYFSSSSKKPKMCRFISFADYIQVKDYLDLKGCLCAVIISLPDHIESEKIYQKYCQEYPQIKPTFKQEVKERMLDDPRFYSYRLKATVGKYVWENEDIIITFNFLDSKATGPDPDQIAYINKVLAPQMPKKREVMIIDRKFYNRLIASKKEEDIKAEKAKKDAADKAALDF